MPLTRLRKKFTPKRPVAKSGDPPRPGRLIPSSHGGPTRRASESRTRAVRSRSTSCPHADGIAAAETKRDPPPAPAVDNAALSTSAPRRIATARS
jgi:hypothetical protein